MLGAKSDKIKCQQKVLKKKASQKIQGQCSDRQCISDNRTLNLETKEKQKIQNESGNRPRCISEETTTSFNTQDDGQDGQLGKKGRHRPRGCRGRGSRRNRSLQRAAERAAALDTEEGSPLPATDSANVSIVVCTKRVEFSGKQAQIPAQSEKIRQSTISDVDHSLGAAISCCDTTGQLQKNFQPHKEYNTKTSESPLRNSFRNLDRSPMPSSSERCTGTTRQHDYMVNVNKPALDSYEGRTQQSESSFIRTNSIPGHYCVKSSTMEATLQMDKAQRGFRFQYHLQSMEYTKMNESDSSLSTSFSRSDRSIAAVSLSSKSSSERTIEVASSYSFCDDAEGKYGEKEVLHSLLEDDVVLEDAQLSSPTSKTLQVCQKLPSSCSREQPNSTPLHEIPLSACGNPQLGALTNFQVPQTLEVEELSILPPMQILQSQAEKPERKESPLSFPVGTISRMFCSSDLSSVVGEDIDLTKCASSSSDRTRKERDGSSLFSTSPKSFLMGERKKRRTREANEMETILTDLKENALGIADSGLKWCYRWF
jgi:hypothetical protein